jgi:hypothetical protein
MDKANKFENLDGNILRCRFCGRFAMIEELDLHECRGLKAKKIEGKILYVFDGYTWYPIKLDQARPTSFDSENFRRRLDRTSKQ